MDFSIFSKPLSVPGLGKSRAAKAREKVRPMSRTLELIQNQSAKGEQLQKFTTTRHGTASERAKAAALATNIPSLEVDDCGTGLSPALENAALLHASGQSDVGLQLLGGAISNDPDTRCLPRAWHAQFDLLQRANDRAAFEQLALEYVTTFESSPPPWDERRKATAAKGQRVMAGYFAITQINVKTALEIPARAARYSSLKIDVATVKVFDDIGCRRMVDVLRRLRRLGYPVVLQGVAALKAQIAEKTRTGVPHNEGMWLFGLEVIQWENNPVAFEERAIEFAVTFEVSPPSWEPRSERLSTQEAVAESEARVGAAIPEAFAMKGILVGPTDPQIAAIVEFAAERSWVPIDMMQVDRIDFVSAGALQNMVSGFMVAGKQVQVIGASPIIESLLLLIGFDPSVLETR